MDNNPYLWEVEGSRPWLVLAAKQTDDVVEPLPELYDKAVA